MILPRAREGKSIHSSPGEVYNFPSIYKPDRRHASISMVREEFMALKPGEELLPSENRVGEKL